MRIDIETTYAAARELRDLLPHVQALIPHATNQVTESDTTSARKATVHRIPWHGEAASLFYDIHAQTRRYENALTLLLHNHAKYRAGDDANTYDAISRLPVLIAHAIDTGHADHTDVTDIDHLLVTTWPRACRLLLDTPKPGDQHWTRAPGDIRCPHCGRPLELAPGWEALRENTQVVCRHCRTDDGHPYTWPITERIGHLQTTELVTERVAHHRFGIGTSTVRRWKQAGKIHPYGHDANTNSWLYRVSDIRNLIDQARRSHRVTLLEFLTARLDEDEASAREYVEYEDEVREAAGWFRPSRVLAEVEAKRHVLDEARVWGEGCNTVMAQYLAEAYANHPDYDPDWRP